MENTKRDLSLDFTKPRHPRGGQSAPSLVTPILNLSTPELNKLISGEVEELAILTPNGISSVIPQSNVLPSPLIPTTVNSNNIINANNNTNGTGTGNQNSSCVNTYSSNTNNNLQTSNKCNGENGNQNQIHKKRSDKCREVDVEKIEKKRERNRLAAKKCRQRKLETIDELRNKVSEWEQRYQRLEIAFEEFKNIRGREIEVLSRENAELKSLIARRS